MTEKITDNENNTEEQNKTSTDSETGEATFSIVRYFKYVLIVGILSLAGLGAFIYFLIWIFSD